MQQETRVGLLGSLLVDGVAGASVVPAGKQRALFAALALRAGRVVSFGELADAVWGSATPADPLVAVRNYVLRLRRALGANGPLVVTMPPGYLLDLPADEVDALAFRRLADSGAAYARARSWPQAARELRAGLALWRGTPLSDIPSPTLHDQWYEPLEQCRLRALRHRIRADLRCGRHETVTAELRELTREQPLDEELWELFLHGLYLGGHQADALAAYQQARRHLVNELGLEPGAALRRRHQQILTHDPALDIPAVPEGAEGATARVVGQDPPTVAAGQAPRPPRAPMAAVPVPRQLPADMPAFAARTTEVALLRHRVASLTGRAAALDSPATQVCVISGAPGIGKTTLAVHVAHQVAAEFPDGQLYVNLRGFHPSGEPISAGQALHGFLGALGVPWEQIPQDAEERAALYRSLLADRRVLVLLDNARDARHVRPLLPGSHRCLVLVTSRRKLTALAATDGAALLGLDLLTAAESREVLDARLGAQFTGGQAGAVADLAALCAGLPLALALAASQAAARPTLPLATLASELRGGQNTLTALSAGEEETSVRAVFSWSYQQLPASAARMFRLLGVHPGPDITAAAAASLAGAAPQEALGQLRELAAAGLLDEPVPGRYTFHDLLRAYATELADAIDSPASQRAGLHRALDHYLHTANGPVLASRKLDLAAPLPGVTPQGIAMLELPAWCNAEYQVIRRLITTALASGLPSYAWQLPWTLEIFLDANCLYQDAEALWQQALAAAEQSSDESGAAHTQIARVRTCLRLGHYDEAEEPLRQALEFFTAKQMTDRQVSALKVLTRLHEAQRRYGDALAAAQAVWRLLDSTEDRWQLAAALNNLGYCHSLTGNYAEALPWCERALTIHEELGFVRGIAHTSDSIGHAHFRLGHYQQAIDWYQRALRAHTKTSSQYQRGKVCIALGDVHEAVGDLTLARAAWQQAQAILEGLHHPDAAEARSRLDKQA